MGNSSSVLQLFQDDDVIKVHVFEPIIRLSKSEAYYYKVQPLGSNDENNRIYFSLQHPNIINIAPIVKNPRRVCSHKNEKAARNANSKILVKPKFTTNQRKSICISPVRNSLKSFSSLPGEFIENSVL